MGVKIFLLNSWFSTILLIYLFEHVQISNALSQCQYQAEGESQPTSMKRCPNICCPNIPRTENTTCCNPVPVNVTSSLTLFGFSWWRVFLCFGFLFITIGILFHYTKRLHILKHSKHFNSVIDPTVAFTISKNEFDMNLNNTAIVLEENPPSYTSSFPPLPPNYASVNPSTIKISE